MNGWRTTLAAIVAGCAAILMWSNVQPKAVPPRLVQHDSVAPESPRPAPPTTLDNEKETEDDERALSFRIPSGEPTAISCDEARRIVNQARTNLAYEPGRPETKAFADATSDWLDPHGLWSLPSDSPASREISRHADALMTELESNGASDKCAAARAIGATLASWTHELRHEFQLARDDARGAAKNGIDDDAKSAANDDLPPTEKEAGRALAIEIGRRVGAVERGYGTNVAVYARAATDRFLPDLDADGWSHVVLAAAVRAYIPLLDPHGGWAPFDEESSIYEISLTSHPPSQLWAKAAPTAIGARILEGASAPLRNDDVLLAIAGVTTAGLPLEQVDQLGLAAGDTRGSVSAVVLRAGEDAPRTIDLAHDDAATEAPTDDHDELAHDDVAYGDGRVLVVRITDVRDDLGDQLARAIANDVHAATTPLEGVVLDLRGNGGGSTDGAIDTLGLFLPGLPLFPMKRRDGSLETDRAPAPPDAERWNGPVATIVDGDTASAAEMIAGALASYKRGPSVGEKTYGKGCAQEYVDDEAHTGVLRLTTLLYALPDGTPVQRVGLTPTIHVQLTTHPADDEREATMPHAPPTWRGPDVRALAFDDADADAKRAGTRVMNVPWPSHGGHVGPNCADEDVCRVLHALGAPSKWSPTAKRTP